MLGWRPSALWGSLRSNLRCFARFRTLLYYPRKLNLRLGVKVLGPEIYLGISGSAPRLELRSNQFFQGPECTVLPRAYFLIEVAAGSVVPESVSGSSSCGGFMKLSARQKYDYKDLDRGEAQLIRVGTCPLARSPQIGRYVAEREGINAALESVWRAKKEYRAELARRRALRFSCFRGAYSRLRQFH
jgi:hypothetical protein